MMFHVVTSGRCWLDVPGAEPRWLETGSLALVPHGDGHSVRSAPGTADTPLFDIPAQRLSERCELMRHGGPAPLRASTVGPDAPSPLCLATCGVVRFEHAAAKQLIALLPRVIEVRPNDDDDGGWLSSTIRFIAREAQTLRPGAETVITRLADILVIQAIRSWLASTGPEEHGYLAGLRDPQVGRAMTLMHQEPERNWQVVSLAKSVGMSRSAFAARFTELLGKPVMAYLTELRLQLALQELRHSSDSVASLAVRYGYQSEAAFSRAFRRAFGMTPRSVRTSNP
jgi:AraC-like DNA-binding protein